MGGVVNAEMMEAAIFDRSELPLTLREIARPDPADHEVLVKVRRCGICTSDIYWSNGEGRTPASGMVLGHEFTGEVAAVGSSVTTWQPGDRVCAMPFAGCGDCPACASGNYLFCPGKRSLWGGFGQYTLAADASCVSIPEALSWDEAALVEPMACGVHAVRLAEIDPAEPILVIGAGPIGLACTSRLRQIGARSITVTARSTGRRDLALAMGATHFIKADDDLEAQSEASGRIPATIFECSGAPGMLMQAIRAVRPHGRVVVAGMCTTPDTIVPATGIIKELRIQFVAAYSHQDFQDAVAALATGNHAPLGMIDKTIGLRQLPGVFEDIRRANPYCKVLVDPWSTGPLSRV